MATIPSETQDISYASVAPVLVLATSDAAMALAERTVEDFGLRVTARETIEQGRDRLARQARASAVWIELDRDAGEPMDQLLTQVSNDVADGRYAAVVSTTAELLDPTVARLDNSTVELIVNADSAQRAAALAIATATGRIPLRVCDVGSDRSADRLRQLSEEVSRIASTLARLSTGPAPSPGVIEPTTPADVPNVAVETVRSAIRARRLRSSYFPDDLFADPAWDMMLDLLQAEIAQLRVPVSSLCIAAAVPATTALRWLKMMVERGIFVRRSDPHDGRRVFVELAPEASNSLHRYFGEVGGSAVL